MIAPTNFAWISKKASQEHIFSRSQAMMRTKEGRYFQGLSTKHTTKEVRGREARSHSLPKGQFYLQDIMRRTLDVSDVVRRQAYTVLATKCKMSDFTLVERACLLRRGLQDRSSPASNAAVTLLQTWLIQECDGSILELLGRLDVRRYPGACLAGPFDLTSPSQRDLKPLSSPCSTFLAIRNS